MHASQKFLALNVSIRVNKDFHWKPQWAVQGYALNEGTWLSFVKKI